MSKNTDKKAVNNYGRRFLRNSAMAIATAVTILAAVALGMTGLAEAQSRNVSNTSFGPIKQIDAGLLNVATSKLDLPMALP